MAIISFLIISITSYFLKIGYDRRFFYENQQSVSDYYTTKVLLCVYFLQKKLKNPKIFVIFNVG